MNERIVTMMLLTIAIIHLLPITGFFNVERLNLLYGIEVEGQDLEILLRHRAILFGLLGVFFAFAAFRPTLQPLSFIAAFVSITSFFYLAFSVGGYNSAIRRVVTADVIALICLVIAVVFYLLKNGT